VAQKGGRIGKAARLGNLAGLLDRRLRLPFEPGPFLLAHQRRHEIGLELRQRIARPFGADERLALIGLGILKAVSRT
jgi:hypothetical protein